MEKSFKELLEKKNLKSTTFFKQTRIASCSKVIAKNGTAFAIPFTPSNQKRPASATPTATPQNKKDRISTSHAAYRQRFNLHVGFSNKPLEPYDPNSKRSQLVQPDYIPPYKNSSQIIIGDRTSKQTRHFLTTSQNYLLTPNMHKLVTNPGILSAQTKWTKYKQKL